MKLNGRRESSNVEDRRGKGGAVAGMGIGGIIIAAIIAFISSGGDMGQVLSSVSEQVAQGGVQTEQVDYQPTPE